MAERRLHKEQGLVPQSGLGIYLDNGDLAELQLRRIHSRMTSGDCSSMHAMSFPRHKVLDDPLISELISILEQQNRVRVDVRSIAHTIAASRSGNVVVYPKEDQSVEEAVRRVELAVLDPVLQLYSEGVVPIKSVTLLPNASPGKPKGIIVETGQRDDKWWRSLQGLKWSLGRGLRVVSLGMNADQFIDQSDELLGETLKAARSFPHGALKYVQFLHDDDGHMFMAVAGGPSYEEADDLTKVLSKAPKKRQAEDLIQSNIRQSRTRRDGFIGALTDHLGVMQEELLVDSPYIGLDLDQGVIFSGATNEAPNGLLPFTVGTSGIIIHTHEPEKAVPIGTKLLSPPGFAPIVPPGVRPHRLSTASDVLFDAGSIQNYIRGFSNPIELQTLALGYHADWGK